MSEVYCIVHETAKLSHPTRKVQLNEVLAYNNAQAHAMRVTLFEDDGTAADLTGASATGSFKRADGQTVEPINGTISGNVAEIILPASCYVAPGRFTFTMNLNKTGGYARTILWVNGIVERNTTDEIVDPGTPVGNIEQAIGQATAAAVAASEAADNANAAATNNLTNFAGAFDVTAAYAAGAYVSYTDGMWYYLPNGHTANTTWANTTKKAVTVGGELGNVKSAFESDYNFQGYPDQINVSNYAEKLPDLNNAEPNRIYAINQCLQSIAHIPSDTSAVTATVMTFTWKTYSNKTWYIQFLVGNGNKFYYRSCWSGVWSDWAQNIDRDALTAYTETDNLYLHGYNPIITADNYSALLSDLDNAEVNRIYIINGCFQSIAKIPVASTAVSATVMTFSRGYRANKSWYIQYAIGNFNDFYYRSCWGGVWSDWQKVVTMNDVISYIDTNDQLLEGYKDQINSGNFSTKLADLNNAEPNRIYAINQCLQSIAHIPSDTSAVTATVMTFTWKTYSNKTWYIQFMIGNGNVFYYRSCWGGVWSAWKYIVSQDDINTSIETDTNKGASKIQDFFVSTCVRKDLTKGISASSKIITIGDSITAGSPSDGYYTWVTPFCDYLGCTATNKAIGGACFGESNPEIPQSRWISTQIAAVTATEWAECDFVFVAAGTNDARYTASYDEIAEKVSADLAAILAALSANGNTTAHVIFITPTRRNTKNNEINLRVPEISGIIENIALTNGCSVICGFDFPIPTDNVIGEEDTVITKMTSDNLHPNLTGSKVYAQSVINAIM